MATTTTYQPENLNFWNRIFNRYKRIAVKEGSEDWYKQYTPFRADRIIYSRDYVIYHNIDRLTGGFTVKKEYLN